jgi:hypothetical protein
MKLKLLSFLIFIAFLGQAVIPVGFMPSADEKGGMTIEICTLHGIELVQIEGDNSSSQDINEDEFNKCAYSTVSLYKAESNTSWVLGFVSLARNVLIPIAEYTSNPLYLNAGRAPPAFA